MSTHRSRIREVLLEHTTPFGKRTAVIDFEALLNALDEFWDETSKEVAQDLVARVFEDDWHARDLPDST